MSKTPSKRQIQAHSFDDFDWLVENFQSWDLEFTRLDRGPFNGNLLQVVGEEFRFCSFFMSCRHEQRVAPPPGFRSFGILTPRSPDVVFRNRKLDQEGIAVFPSGEESDSQNPPGWEASEVSFSDNLLESVSQRMGHPLLEDMLVEKDIARCNQTALEEFRSWLQGVRQQFSAHLCHPLSKVFLEQIIAELPGRFLKTMASSYPMAFRPSLRQRDRAINKIKEFLSEFPSVPPTMADLCEVAKVSERTLEYAFQERYEMTPTTYLRFYRLNGAHKALRTADPASTTVTNVATDWGFCHFGDFASHYQKLFGQRPSDTLKKPSSGRQSF
ncbi:MAG: helix-turn-helix domain-containing protein [Nitrospirales bacterium]